MVTIIFLCWVPPVSTKLDQLSKRVWKLKRKQFNPVPRSLSVSGGSFTFNNLPRQDALPIGRVSYYHTKGLALNWLSTLLEKAEMPSRLSTPLFFGRFADAKFSSCWLLPSSNSSSKVLFRSRLAAEEGLFSKKTWLQKINRGWWAPVQGPVVGTGNRRGRQEAQMVEGKIWL